MKIPTRLLSAAAVALLGVVGAGCSSDSDDDFVFASTDEGTVEVYAVDAPPELDRLRAAVIRIQSIQLEGETDLGQDVTRTILDAPAGTPLEVDLLQLRGGRMDLLARDDVPPADYDRVILNLVGARVDYEVGGSTQTYSTDDGTVTIPPQWTINLPGGLLDVNPGDTDQVVLDFDLAQTLDVQGPTADPTGFAFVQNVTGRQLFLESIRGVVREDAGTAGQTNDDTPREGAIVRVFQNGTEVTSTKTDAQGVYVLQSIAPGQYELRLNETGFTAVNQPVTVNQGAQTTSDVTLESTP